MMQVTQPSKLNKMTGSSIIIVTMVILLLCGIISLSVFKQSSDVERGVYNIANYNQTYEYALNGISDVLSDLDSGDYQLIYAAHNQCEKATPSWPTKTVYNTTDFSVIVTVSCVADINSQNADRGNQELASGYYEIRSDAIQLTGAGATVSLVQGVKY